MLLDTLANNPHFSRIVSGIYGILHEESRCLYVGSSCDIKSRVSDHAYYLRRNKKGAGIYKSLCEGITTYPSSVDDNQMKIHAGCLLLEAEGKIRRHLVTKNYIVWMPNDENSPNL